MEKLERGTNALENRLKGRTGFTTTLHWPWRIYPWHAPCTGDSSLLSTVRCVILTLTSWDGIRGLRATMEWKAPLAGLTWLRNVKYRRNSYIAELWYLSRPSPETCNSQSFQLNLKICIIFVHLRACEVENVRTDEKNTLLLWHHSREYPDS